MTVITNPSTYNSVLTQSGAGIFDDPSTTTNQGVLPLQVLTSQPTLPTLEQQTNMVSADRSTAERMTHFDPDLYDVRDTSHLSRFMRALLGDAGVGQLHKRYTLTRLESTLDGTNFYDLDGFYGSLLSVPRRADERLPVDPMDPKAGMASEDDWDTMLAADARYRERIINLARALVMAGTPQGIKSMAETLMDAPCALTETWKLVDEDFANVPNHTWDEVMGSYANWDAMADSTWEEVSGVVHLGYEGIDTPDEAYVTTYKSYEDYPTAEAQQAARAWDEAELLRVLDIIKPAGVLLSVNSSGIVNTVAVNISAVAADSEYWSITKTIYPNTDPGQRALIPVYQATSQNGAEGISVPLPPFSGSQQFEWYANSSVTQIIGRIFSGDFNLTTGEHTAQDSSQNGNNGWTRNFETINFPGVGKSFTFYPGYAVLSPRVLLGGQAVNDSVMVAHPYAASRAGGKAGA